MFFSFLELSYFSSKYHNWIFRWNETSLLWCIPDFFCHFVCLKPTPLFQSTVPSHLDLPQFLSATTQNSINRWIEPSSWPVVVFFLFFLKIRFTWIAITRRKICYYFQFIVTNSLETFLGHYSNVSKFVTLAMWTQMFLLPLKFWIVVKYWIMWSSGVHAARGLLSLKQMSNKPNTETFFRFNHFSVWLWLKLLWG